MPESTQQIDTEPKVAIVTGANTGIGRETVRALFKQGYHVILACRTQERANEAIQDIIKTVPDKPQENLEFLKLELDSLQSVREFAQSFLSKNIPLHLLTCNAGVMGCPFGKTRDGIEQTFAVNHLAHFLLTDLLLDKLKESAPSRIVIVSSGLHKKATDKTLPLTQEKLNDPNSYDRFGAYNNSKLCNVLHANELTRRLRKEGINNVTVNSLHPGTTICFKPTNNRRRENRACQKLSNTGENSLRPYFILFLDS